MRLGYVLLTWCDRAAVIMLFLMQGLPVGVGPPDNGGSGVLLAAAAVSVRLTHKLDSAARQILPGHTQLADTAL